MQNDFKKDLHLRPRFQISIYASNRLRGNKKRDGFI